jgi:two-component system response regulator AgrA
MYNFVICEDNLNTASIIKGFITEYTAKKNLDCHIHLFQDHFEKVIEFAEANLGHINVYFMDIILNQENASGLTLARQIRKIDIMAYIVFITSHPELSLKVFQYKLKALDYIYKQDENIQKRIQECIDTVLREMVQLGNVDVTRQITLKSYNNFYTVNLNDIMYVETRPSSRMLYCVLKNGTCIEFYDTMKALIKRLDSRFYQCHRSFIINTRQIKKLGGNRYYSVVMNDGKVCDVSKQKWKELVNRVRS